MTNTTKPQLFRFITATAEQEVARRVFKLTATQSLNTRSGTGLTHLVFSCEGTVIDCTPVDLGCAISQDYAKYELEAWLTLQNDFVDAALEWPSEFLSGPTITSPGPLAELQQMVDEARGAEQSLRDAAAARFTRASQVCGGIDQILDAAVMMRMVSTVEGFLTEGKRKAAASIRQGAIAEALSNAVTRMSASYGAVIEEVRAFKNWAAEEDLGVVRELAGLVAYQFGFGGDDRAAFEHGYAAGFRDGVAEWGQEQMRVIEEAASAAVAAEVWVMEHHRTPWMFGYVRGYEAVATYNASAEANHGQISLHDYAATYAPATPPSDQPRRLLSDEEYASRSLNGIEYIDFKARCYDICNGYFKFIVQVLGSDGYEDSDARFEMLRSNSDQTPSLGYFGLPEFTGEEAMFPNVHTVRLNIVSAHDQGILTYAN